MSDATQSPYAPQPPEIGTIGAVIDSLIALKRRSTRGDKTLVVVDSRQPYGGLAIGAYLRVTPEDEFLVLTDAPPFTTDEDFEDDEEDDDDHKQRT